jgi:cystathionine beta-synthase
LPLFDRGLVAIVVDGERFLGLITRIDLLNHLRRRIP